jgi:hypothetical protein
MFLVCLLTLLLQVFFIQEFCNLSKHLQPVVRSQLFGYVFTSCNVDPLRKIALRHAVIIVVALMYSLLMGDSCINILYFASVWLLVIVILGFEMYSIFVL